jgi:hypothetical protein
MPAPNELLDQITEAWAETQQQFETLRQEVERTAELAQLGSRNSRVTDARDKALRELGEAVWSQVQKGKLTLPAALSSVMKAVEEVDRRRKAQTDAVLDILKEGEEAADRMKGPHPSKTIPKQGVAQKGKKR